MFVNASNQKLLQLLLEECLSLILIVVWPEANLQTLMLQFVYPVQNRCLPPTDLSLLFHYQKEAF